ncbi:MAG: glucosyltransferase domain-containing protein [Desulfovibrio sp.]|nr:glucosyltransferase domain-containing protein [Desulfovibrio sp.]
MRQGKEDFRSPRARRWLAGLKADLRSRYFAGLLLIYLVGISALLRADYLFLDDLGRAMTGMRGWGSGGRPLSDFFASLFYLSSRTFDASPLTQLTATGILALVSLLLLKAARVKTSWPSVLCLTPVGLSPYILENLSFKFDSPYMAAALLFAVLPPALTFLKNRSVFFLAAAVCLYCACALYHAALGAYVCIAAWLLLSDLSSRKPARAALRRACALALPFVAGVGAFTVVSGVLNSLSSFHSRIVNALAIPPPSGMPAVLARNIGTYFEVLFYDWSPSCFGWLMALCFALFAALTFMRWNRNRLRVKPRSGETGAFAPFPRLAALLLLTAFLPMSIFGLQFFMQNPPWWARYFQSFGFLPALCLLGIRRTATKGPQGKAAAALCGLMTLQLVLFADVYGNLLARQREWEFLHFAPLYADLRKLVRDGDCKTVIFKGSIGHTPLMRTPASKFPILRRLVRVYAGEDYNNGYWSGKQLRIYGITADRVTKNPDASTLRQVRTDNAAYTIAVSPEGTAVVTFFPVEEIPPLPEMLRSDLERN